MKKAICHYSYHRTWKAQGWDLERLTREVRGLGVEGIDFHVRYLGDPEQAADAVKKAIASSGLMLSGLSMSNNFNHECPEALAAEIESVKVWLRVAADVEAPVSRIFGGHLAQEDRRDPAKRAAGRQRILDVLGAVAAEAESLGVVLALENHGGLPCKGEEQVDVIETIGSPSLKATVDVGNYMQGGQEGHEGTEIAAEHCAYVHFKDNVKVPDESTPWGWSPRAAVLGEGDVDLEKCVKVLDAAGYDGFTALEYEAAEDELTGVARSVEAMKRLIS